MLCDDNACTKNKKLSKCKLNREKEIRHCYFCFVGYEKIMNKEEKS
mgnify:FL=1